MKQVTIDNFFFMSYFIKNILTKYDTILTGENSNFSSTLIHFFKLLLNDEGILISSQT